MVDLWFKINLRCCRKRSCPSRGTVATFTWKDWGIQENYRSELCFDQRSNRKRPENYWIARFLYSKLQRCQWNNCWKCTIYDDFTVALEHFDPPLPLLFYSLQLMHSQALSSKTVLFRCWYRRVANWLKGTEEIENSTRWTVSKYLALRHSLKIWARGPIADCARSFGQNS
jgi:hypothetical protein